jgi:hypothetical protein
MNALIYTSLILNIVVLVPIIVLMIVKAKVVDHAWGVFTPARGILMSIYFSILVASLALLFVPVPAFVVALLMVQVVYKITTPFTVGITNPIVISNLAISALHIVTVITVFAEVGNQFVPVG